MMAPDSFVRLARAFCAQQLPWFAPALFRCRIHFTDQVSVAAIDPHFNIYFNPAALEEIEAGTNQDLEKSLSELGFIWIHEISHVLREHNSRSEAVEADSRLWNMAADLEINDSHWEGLNMPETFPGIRPETFGQPTGKLAEFYYRSLAEQQEEKINDALRQSEGLCVNDLPDEGSGVHGEQRPWEVEASGAAQQLEDIEVEMVRRAVAKEICEQVKMGSMPGDWNRWAEEKLRPQVDWRQVLRHRMTFAINQGVGNRIDYSFRRPNRRQAVYEPVLPPSLNGDLKARIACVVDTSGSMGPGQLGQVVAEVFSVLKTFRIPVTIIPCDATAYDPIRIAHPGDYFKLEQLRGGGGTDMVAGIEAALELKPSPDTVLVLTDGYTPYPPRMYKVPVVFGILETGRGYGNNRPPDPPWKPDTIVSIPLAEHFSYLERPQEDVEY